MAKATTIKVKLVSSADTGFYYVTKKNSRTMTDKLVKKKYDPVAKKHVEFRESKIKWALRLRSDRGAPSGALLRSEHRHGEVFFRKARWPARSGVMRRPLTPPPTGRTPRTQEMRRT